ncbi:2Fe-2S iron-sulfur cluster-binding protein [Pontibacter silvestris]|uniref:2Fe-2S iron-sulfur cluster-binding protein n=1 Tax=Pontibacter silvestris TaxID=2305183 RepID=A0ABW4X2Q5_9BACT|nr:2Fe-2S iron-sulfur cluster-binding protein [Pontibacter silvestris]MCC9137087.1 (2Fe-2S)-binding protein [Pontibacter silvestris]
MPKFTVQNLANCKVAVEQGQTLLKALQAGDIDWMHACGGKGRCTSCRVIVLQGMQNTGPLTASEIKYRNNGRLRANERLTCQCILETGDIVGEVPEQTKLPHLTYTN